MFDSEKFKEKCKKKKKIEKNKIKKIKNKFKINKLFLYITPSSYHLFNSLIWILNNF